MKYAITTEAGVTSVRISGELGDDIDPELDAIVAAVRTPRVVLDCGELEAMNSTGIAAWCAFVRRLEATSQLELREVPAIMVHYAGMVRHFFGKDGTLSSVRVPYYCKTCRASTQPLMDTATLVLAQALPEPLCSTCKGALGPEVDSESYLDALQRSAKSAS